MQIYKVGQVCVNGHAITGNVEAAASSKFCPRCGEETIVTCPSCRASIRGNRIIRSDFGNISSGMHIPAFCHACGKPFPWTERAVAAAKELVDEVEGIETDEREKAKSSFIALASDTAQTTVAATRVNKLIAKAGPILGKGIRDIVVSIATDAAKKAMGL
ncbi:DUF2321 domain-containing protein [Mesorhizobium sp. M0027]|uniref:DUF2321 domain-containing protein n=1 Tax=unclassified Mesorhizobium TaxID=325217 RepID=UPI0018DB14D0|nr:DUF2321 domain-containing protein [Mesorhizobium sp. LSHC420B00]